MGTSVILVSSLSALLILSVQAGNIGYGHHHNPCPPGKVLSPCGGACPATCDNMEPVCITMCQPGCVCRDGLVDDGHGRCVRREDCCRGNMVYSKCGNDCPQNTCPPPDNLAFMCGAGCSAGCFCRPGFKRLGNKCVHPRDCPRRIGHPHGDRPRDPPQDPPRDHSYGKPPSYH
ncbi:serine protease inhibitor swm-1-like [Dendropsophus ebraccatus]|uniref:serine protease inhibitor swm-1-like n=1 Tax=Dendropsophus ebraccatus TaxID=150705 RepID=UPI003831DC02